MLTCVNLLARLGLAWLGSAWLASLARYNSPGIHQIFLTKNSSNFPDKKLDRKNRTLIASRNVILFPGWNHGSAIGWHSNIRMHYTGTSCATFTLQPVITMDLTTYVFENLPQNSGSSRIFIPFVD